MEDVPTLQMDSVSKIHLIGGEKGGVGKSMVARLLANKCAVEVPPSDSFANQTRFGAGDLLFDFGSSSGLPFYSDAVTKGGKFKWDIALLPNTGKPAVNLYGASISIYKTTPEKELAAWLVLKFLGEKAQTTKWAVQTGYLPVRQSAKADVIAAFKNNPMVWFGTNNEPSETDASGNWNPPALSDWQKATYDAVRNTGNTSPVLLEANGWSNNGQPVIDIYGSVDGTDLGSVGDAVRAEVEAARAKLPRGSDLKPVSAWPWTRSGPRQRGSGPSAPFR